MQLSANKVNSEHSIVWSVFMPVTQRWILKMARLGEIAFHQRNVIFCGYFNAKDRSWSNISSSKQGEDLKDAKDHQSYLHQQTAVTLEWKIFQEGWTVLLTWHWYPLLSVQHAGRMSYDSNNQPCSILVKKGKSRTHRLKV